MENNKKKRPFFTIKDIIIGGIVVIFTAIAFGKPIPFLNMPAHPQARNVLQAEVTDLVNNGLIETTAQQISDKIDKKDGKPSLMLIYASWCSYCKFLIPDILSLRHEGKLDNINVFFLSIDKDKSELANYLLKYNYDKEFTPYIIKNGGQDELEIMMINKNRYYNGVPYTIIFNDDGKIISTIAGSTSKNWLRTKLQQAKEEN